MQLLFFFCKQKTEDEVRISVWSSDVCSSDLDVTRSTRRYRETTARGGTLRASRVYQRDAGVGPGDRRNGHDSGALQISSIGSERPKGSHHHDERPCEDLRLVC